MFSSPLSFSTPSVKAIESVKAQDTTSGWTLDGEYIRFADPHDYEKPRWVGVRGLDAAATREDVLECTRGCAHVQMPLRCDVMACSRHESTHGRGTRTGDRGTGQTRCYTSQSLGTANIGHARSPSPNASNPYLPIGSLWMCASDPRVIAWMRVAAAISTMYRARSGGK